MRRRYVNISCFSAVSTDMSSLPVGAHAIRSLIFMSVGEDLSCSIGYMHDEMLPRDYMRWLKSVR